MFEIRQPISRRNQLLVSGISVVLFLVVWGVLTYGEYLPSSILPPPDTVLSAISTLHFEEALVRNIGFSVYRVMMGFLLATVVAIPIGILAGTFPFIKACIQPFMGPLRYLPIGAVLPLFLIWFGIGETMKIMLLFVGTVVYMLPLIVETVESIEEVYFQTAYTLGASRLQVIAHVIVPAAMPSIFEALRVMSGIGWTYVLLAEIVNTTEGYGGLGYLINIAYKRGHVDQVIAAVLIILVIGILTDRFFLFLNQALFRWKEDARHGQ